MKFIAVGKATQVPPDSGDYEVIPIGEFIGIDADTARYALWECRTYICFPGDESWKA